ncbi:hypothetical protein BH20ACI3_BH20ACI3_42470 [soil metagenome]
MIFIASAEVRPLPGSQMKDRGVGASVYCLIPADSKSAGEAKLRSCLEQDKYRLVKLEFLKKYEEFRWENAQDQVEYDLLAKRAALHDELVYGTFYTWAKE